MSEQTTDNAAETAPATPAAGLLSDTGTGAEVQPTTPPSWEETIPAKFKGADGKVDFESMTKSYLHMEQRMGAGEAPPKTPNDYKLTLPEGLNGEHFAGFKQLAFDNGMNQKQADAVIGSFLESLPLFMSEVTPSPQRAEAQLRETWTSQADYDKNLSLAKKAFAAYSGDGIDAIEMGNNPSAMRLLAKIGATMGEDRAVNAAAILAPESVAELMQQRAKLSPASAQYKAIQGKIDAHYANKYPK
jgi:hypothetical protein